MYHKCSQCGATNALKKCACLVSTYYCNAECQSKHSGVHQLECTVFLLGRLARRQADLDVLKAADTVSQPLAVLEAEQTVAMLHCNIGRIMGISQQPGIYGKAIEHCREALYLHRKVCSFCETATGSTLEQAKKIVVAPCAVYGLYDTLHNIGDLCRFDQRYTEGIAALTMALDELRAVISLQTTEKLETTETLETTSELQSTLAFILGSMANLHLHQHHDTVHQERHFTDVCDCNAAVQLLEEAITIWRKLAQDDHLAQALLFQATVLNDRGRFAQADVFLKESLALGQTRMIDKDMHVAACYQQIAFNSLGQASKLRDDLYLHKMFLLTNSLQYYLKPSNMVRIAGLQRQTQYNGVEALVMDVGTTRITVCLQSGGDANKLLKIKPENAHPLIDTPAALHAKFQKIQQLNEMQIDSSTKSHQVQLKMTGKKHVNAAITSYTLALAYMQSNRPKPTLQALELLKEANVIRLKIRDQHVERARDFPLVTKAVEDAVADFKRPDFLSAMPCCWPASSRRHDKKDMRQLFSALQARTTGTVSSEAALHCLRLYGLEGVAASSSDSVGTKEFVLIACDALQNMKRLANPV